MINDFILSDPKENYKGKYENYCDIAVRKLFEENLNLKKLDENVIETFEIILRRPVYFAENNILVCRRKNQFKYVDTFIKMTL